MTKAMLDVQSIRVTDAKLPATYEAARSALAECYRVDECRKWGDKAAALASYAKQAEDDSLHKTAVRIQGRAIKRCGELLKELDRPTQGGRPSKNGEGAHPVSMRAVADAAGMSDHQRKQAVRVANVPQETFEELIESEKPPSVTALAEMGKKERPKPLVDLEGRDPEDFALSTSAQGKVRELAKFSGTADPRKIVAGAFDHELTALHQNLCTLGVWLDAIALEISEQIDPEGG